MLFVLLAALVGQAHADAEALLRAGQVNEALSEIRAELAEHPDDIASHELLIDVLMGTGAGEQALETYRARADDHPQDADAWYLRGRAEPKAADATRAYQRSLELNPREARAWMGLGAVHRAMRQLDDAASAYRHALDLDPSLAEAWSGLITTQVSQGQRAEATTTARAAVAAVPDQPEVWLALAALAPEKGLLERAIQRIPDDPRLHLALAREHFDHGDWTGATQAYQASLTLAPEQPEVRVEAALVQEIQAGVLSPEGAQALLQIRSSAAQGATVEELRRRVDEIVQANPQSGWALLVRGNLSTTLIPSAPDKAAALQGAEHDLRMALSRMPTSPEAQAALGMLLLSAQRPAEALPFLEQAAGARDTNVSLVVAAGVAMAEAGEGERAELLLREAQARFPGSSGPTLALARLMLGRGDAEGAYQLVSLALQRTPDPDLVLALAAAARTAGREDVAADLLEQLAKETGDTRLSDAAASLRGTPASTPTSAPR